MVTRCPSCDTLFRVTPQHLQAYHGQVRCGRCMTVFDGFKALAMLPDLGALDTRPSTAAEDVAPADGGNLAPAGSDAAPIRPGPGPSSQPEISASATAVPERAQDAIADIAPVPPEPTAGALGWSVGIASLFLVLAAQAFLAYRVELAANHPGLKPVVVRVCDLFGCSVPLPQRPRLITIEASDMQVQDQTRPGVVQLTATLRNHAGFEVGFPALDLVLTNTKEHTLARRIFIPEEYLGPRRNGPAGLGANAEVTIRLVLDTGDLGAAGFRLALLPAR